MKKCRTGDLTIRFICLLLRKSILFLSFSDLSSLLIQGGYVNMYEVDVKDILAYNHLEEEIITDEVKLLEENVI